MSNEKKDVCVQGIKNYKFIPWSKLKDPYYICRPLNFSNFLLNFYFFYPIKKQFNN